MHCSPLKLIAIVEYPPNRCAASTLRLTCLQTMREPMLIRIVFCESRREVGVFHTMTSESLEFSKPTFDEHVYFKYTIQGLLSRALSSVYYAL